MSNINFTAIDVTYPIAGINNNSQGFRDNFTAIKNGLAEAASEINTLQNINKIFDLVVWNSGKTTANQVLIKVVIPRTTTYVLNFVGSTSSAVVAATTQTVFTIKKNNVQIGTITFASAADSATYTSSAINTFAANDVLSIVAPASPDSTLSDISFIISGTQ